MRRALKTLALAGLLIPTLVAADTYRIDPVHSAVTFRVRYLVGKVAGRFGTFSGTILLDQARPAASSVEARIEAASIGTANEARDKHLQSPDFFDVARFPALTFKSTRVVETAKGRLEVTGDLAMHGVTRPVTLQVSFLGTMENPRSKALTAGFSATTRLNRKDFGISYGIPMIGEDVDVELEILAEKLPPSK